jgi:hypothetical protein
MSQESTDTFPSEEVMNDFKKILIDMTRDILTTFPEYEPTLNIDLKNLLADNDSDNSSLNTVYLHCKKVYPERFFEILYQNNELFSNDVYFLPDINFSALWRENITDKTRDTIWKYLQLVLFTIVSTISDGSSFGDTAKLFEAINEDEFKAKLEDTISQMQHMFSNNDNTNENPSENAGEGPNINLGDLPNPQDIHDHVSSMLDGKLGKLAKEIAAETAADLNIDMEDATSVDDVFKRLFKNPTKLMGLVKNVGNKLDAKLKSGDLNETELLKEASEMVQKMKDMPGMGNLQNMMSKMGMGMPGGGGSGGSKVNIGAMQSHIDRNLKASQQKDRMRSKLLARKEATQKEAASAEASSINTNTNTNTNTKIHKVGNDNGIENLVFTTGENVERSSRTEQSQSQPQSSGKKKKNKKKN